MKHLKKPLVLLLALLLLAALALCVCAKEYTYTVRLYAGSRGTVLGEEVVVYDGLHYGDRLTFRVEDVELEPDSKYYVRGFRESGRDNDTVDVPSFVVTSDRDYVVAYGVRGNLVAYTVRYLDENGDPLLEDRIFYGNVGDKPVVGFFYIDGYQPQVYNLTKTLSENAAENVFPFTYIKAPASADSGETQTGTNAPESVENLPGNGESSNPAEGEQQPEEILDLDPPLAGPGGGTIFGDLTFGNSIGGWIAVIAICVLVILLLLFLLLFLLRRKKRREK